MASSPRGADVELDDLRLNAVDNRVVDPLLRSLIQHSPGPVHHTIRGPRPTRSLG